MKCCALSLLVFAATLTLGVAVGATLYWDTLAPIDVAEIRSEVEQFDVEAAYAEEFDRWSNDDENKFTIKLLEVGEGFHGDEIRARSGEVWFGLFGNERRSEVRRARLIIRRVKDDVLDSAGEKTGKSVRVAGNEQPLFLFKNADFIKEGPVTTLSAWPTSNEPNEEFFLTNGFDRSYRLGDREYRLHVTGGPNSLHLRLSSGGVEQTVFSVSQIGDATWNLVWVGDLDRDGKLDLLANLPVHYNFGQLRLFLSSQAEPGKLVKQVALFHTTGC